MPERLSVSRSCSTRRLCQSHGPRGGHASKLAFRPPLRRGSYRSPITPSSLCRSSTFSSTRNGTGKRGPGNLQEKICERKKKNRRGEGGREEGEESSNGDGSRARGPNRGFIFCGVPLLSPRSGAYSPFCHRSCVAETAPTRVFLSCTSSHGRSHR